MTPTVLDLRTGWPLYAGMSVAGAAAVVASASTLATLARAAGWAGWTSWLLPASLDVGGSVGGWVWLRPGAPPRARRAGRIVALSGAVTSLIGNGAGHLITTGYLHPGPALVVIVGAVPAAVLVALAHLSALLVQAEQAEQPEQSELAEQPEPTPQPVEQPEPTPQPVEQPEPTPQPVEPVDQADQADQTQEDRTQEDVRDDDPPTDAVEVDTRAAVLAAVQAEPVTVADLVKATGRSRTTIVGHLTALTEDGVIARDDDKRYRPLTRPHAVRHVEEPAS